MLSQPDFPTDIVISIKLEAMFFRHQLLQTQGLARLPMPAYVRDWQASMAYYMQECVKKLKQELEKNKQDERTT